MQQQLLPMHSAQHLTTETIQKHLDENKQLILAILENQNLGRLNECAAYQARLQANLMYLAAIADSEPQPSANAQVASPAAMQTGLHYMARPQAQQMVQQSLMASRNPLQYSQQSLSSLNHFQQQQQQQQQHLLQIILAQNGMHLGGNNNVSGIPSERGMVGNSSLTGGSHEFVGGNTRESLQVSGRLGEEMRGSELDFGSVPDDSRGTSGGDNGGIGARQTANASDASYLKGSEEEES